MQQLKKRRRVVADWLKEWLLIGLMVGKFQKFGGEDGSLLILLLRDLELGGCLAM
jgi:hypothetical protein